MPGEVKIVLIGAGSECFGPRTVADLMTCTELVDQVKARVVLVDVDKTALDRVLRLSQMLKEHHKSAVELEATTDRTQALPGANFVVTAVEVNRMPLWREDQLLAFAHGFKAIYSENGGPGAAFHTLRAMHQMVPIAKDIERLCPDALLLNFSNPESRVCLAVSKLTRVRAVGLCHGAVMTHKIVAGLLGSTTDAVNMTIGGINHFHWVMKLEDTSTGEDLYPVLREALATGERPAAIPPLADYLFKTFGLLPFPADSHIGEYVSFAHPITGPLLLSPKIKPDVQERAWMDDMLAGRRPLDDGLAGHSEEFAVPLLCGVQFDKGVRILSVNVPNEGAAVENLPQDGIVEVPGIADANGVHPERVGALPEGIAAMCRLQMAIQNLLVEAYDQRSRNALLQALLLDPVVDHPRNAEAMMNSALARQSEYLPQFE